MSTPDTPLEGHESDAPSEKTQFSPGEVDALMAAFSGAAKAPMVAARFLKHLQSVAYNEPVERKWTERWGQILEETGKTSFPRAIESMTNVQSRLILLRGYGVQACTVTADVENQTIELLETLTESPDPHIAASAHHLAGRLISVSARLPNMAVIDPAVIKQNIEKRRRGVAHYKAVQTTNVPAGEDPVQLCGAADLHQSTWAEGYDEILPKGVERPVTQITRPDRLLGDALQAIATLSVLIGKNEDAVNALREGLAAQEAYLAKNGESDSAFNAMNFRVAACASKGVAAYLQQKGDWAMEVEDPVHTWKTQTELSVQLRKDLQETELFDWKRAEWNACIAAGLAMAAPIEQDEWAQRSIDEVLTQLEVFINARPAGAGGPDRSRQIIGHDAIYATVIKLRGTPLQQERFAGLIANDGSTH